MTRKHFVELARILKNMKPICCEITSEYIGEINMWENMCNQMADFCAAYNINFDRYRFLSACGVDDG